ncbi:hypothetical protein BDW02DRAFT_93873 [Decorospora gaudefroyi]|uniref:Uncharacterized protein n=1 Tax=Decorospora gaudefroyi TaxID=184978 RepID=A0A6A5KB46_9PLEO|nr:hypothetical protein BDW02DRAFT_93873 [Decorospora gaudefroyi]
MPYANACTQTLWAGLTKTQQCRPEMLLSAPDTTTPPAEMVPDKQAQGLDGILAASHLSRPDANASSFRSLRERRQNRPDFPTRISLPNSDMNDEIMPSPPPTHALLSPLPAANKRHAGHTPLIPRALSPVQDEEQAPPVEDEEAQTTTPPQDQPLIGPLMLPTNPVDGASDHIALDVLDDVLEKVAKDQDRFSKLKDAPEPSAVAIAEDYEEDLPLSRKGSGSADSRKSSTVEVVDGVKLKSPPLNFGAPIGQV